MPIAKYKPDQPKQRIDIKVSTTPKIIHTPTEFHSQQPLTTLLQYVDGSAWTVDYYRQITPDTVTSDTLDTSIDNPYQQFEKIHTLKLKVQSALAASYDESTAATKIAGSSLCPSIFVPNINDYLVASIDASIQAVLRVTQVDRKSHLKESVYEIYYQVIAYSNLNPDIFQTLNSKVVKDYHYDEELQVRNLKPLITTQEKQDRDMIGDHYREILQHFSRSFYRKDLGMFLVPSQPYKIYDSEYMNFLYSLVGRSETEELRNSHHVDLDGGNPFHSLTIYDVLRDRNYAALPEVNSRYVFMHRNLFNRNGWVRNIRTTMLDYVVVPFVDDSSLYAKNDREMLRYFDDIGMYERNYEETNNHQGFLASMLNFNVQQADFTKRLIHPVLFDARYILTEQFYAGKAETSILEDLITAYLKGEAIQVDMLKTLVLNYRKFARLEQFYYTAFILLLLKETSKMNSW